MGVADDSDRDMAIYDRLGPKSRAVIGGAHRVINIAGIVQLFTRSRKIPDPIEVNGEFYPAPPRPSIYGPGAGDDEFAAWLESNVIKGDCGRSVSDLRLGTTRTGLVTKQANRLHAAMSRRFRSRRVA